MMLFIIGLQKIVLKNIFTHGISAIITHFRHKGLIYLISLGEMIVS